MTNTKTWVIGGIAFLALAGGTAVVAKSQLPKTSVANISFTDCVATNDVPLEFDLNQTVKLTVTSDKDGELKIENYNIDEQLKAGEDKSVTFKTVRSGIFDAKVSGCEKHSSIKVRDESGTLPESAEHTSTDEDHEESESTEADAESTQETPDNALESHDETSE